MNYPEQIETEYLNNYKLSADLKALRNDDSEIIEEFTMQVATDPALSNDTKRKAALKMLLAGDVEHLQLAELIRDAEGVVARSNARLERLRGEFAVWKLEVRDRISMAEASN